MTDPFNIGGYDPIPEPLHLDLSLTFADREGRVCNVYVAGIAAAFLALDAEGLIPDPGDDWRAGLSTLDAFQQTTLMAEEISHYSGLIYNIEAICACCGSECHAQFSRNGEHLLIERWSIVTTVMILVDRSALPKLPFQWYTSLEQHYERICETGRLAWAQGSGGACDV